MAGRILERIIIELALLALSSALGFVCWNLLALLMTPLEGPEPSTYRDRFAGYLGELRRAVGWQGLLLPYPGLVSIRLALWARRRRRAGQTTGAPVRPRFQSQKAKILWRPNKPIGSGWTIKGYLASLR